MTQRQKLALWLGGGVILLGAVGIGLPMSVGFPWNISFLALASGNSPQDPSADRRTLVPALAEQTTSLDSRGEVASTGSVQSSSYPEQQEKIPVKAARLDSIQPDKMVQRFSGIILPRRTSRLAAKHLGRVIQIHVDLGDSVEAGQILAELDSRELVAERDILRSQLLSAEARLEELQQGPRTQEIEQAEAAVRELEAIEILRKSNLKRTEQLVQSGSVSKQEWDENLASLEATQAQLANARKTLELLREGTRQEQIDSQAAIVQSLHSQLDKVAVLISEHSITAPFSGQVQTRFVDEGVILTPGQPIVELVESDCLEVHVGLPFSMTDPVTLGSAEVICGSQRIPAIPTRVAPTIDQRTRNQEVVFSLPNTQKNAIGQPGERDSGVDPAAPNRHRQALDRGAAGQTMPAAADSCNFRYRIGEAVDVVVQVPTDRAGWWVPSSALVPAARGLWSVLIVKPGDTSENSSGGSSDRVAPEGIQSEGIGRRGGYLVANRQVELLRSSGDWSQVQGPLNADDLIILHGAHRVTLGQLVHCLIATEDVLDDPARALDGTDIQRTARPTEPSAMPKK